MRKLKLAVVDWADSSSVANGRIWWREGDLPETVIDTTLRSVGYEIRRNAMEIVLASAKNGDHDNFADPFGIPMGCVKKIQYIKEPK